MMWIGSLALAMLLAGPNLPIAEDGRVEREQLVDLLQSLHSEIRDFEYRFEGEHRRLQEMDYSTLPEPIRAATRQNPTLNQSLDFQGTIAFRRDEAAHLAVYERPLDATQPTERVISCLLGGVLSRRTMIPDRGGQVGGDEANRGSIVGMFRGNSPFKIYDDVFMLYRLADKSKSKLDYQFVGWDKVAGQKCLVFELFGVDRETGERLSAERYWIDVSRGGWSLRTEKYNGPNLMARAIDIELSRFPSKDGREYWFPIRGRFQIFRNGLGFSKSPVLEQTFRMLAGTLRINQDPRDERFKLDWGLDDAAKAQAKAVIPKPAPPDRDRRGIEESIKVALKKADEQSAELVATSPSRSPWIFQHGLPIGIAATGLAVFLTAGYLRKKHS